VNRRSIGMLSLDGGVGQGGAMPQDIRSSPSGNVFYVADMKAGGVVRMDPESLRQVGFIQTGTGTHGLYPSRDGKLLYVTNRGWTTVRAASKRPGSSRCIDFKTRR